ncbi:MAG: hypothetical protein EHM45_07500 [Desulfobacteraceae bacterium]|nr:MAG: hypothetical protein EHM45_07500 [Desulfobacteraceae bacterium]
MGYYLSQVGGITDKADKKQIYVVKANGSVVSKRQGGQFSLLSWDKQKHQWSSGGFDSMPLDAGDTIIVPPKIEKGAWMRFAKDLTEIVYKIAVGAGVLKTIGVF